MSIWALYLSVKISGKLVREASNVDQIFSICSTLAMAGWLTLVFVPRFPFVVNVLTRMLIPAAIGLIYLFLMATNIGNAPVDGNFGSLAGVKAMFTVDALLLAGWIHYLAFDLFVGSWEVEDARANGVHHLLVIPCLGATLMAGPAGLVLYLLIRTGVKFFRDRQPTEVAA